MKKHLSIIFVLAVGLLIACGKYNQNASEVIKEKTGFELTDDHLKLFANRLKKGMTKQDLRILENDINPNGIWLSGESNYRKSYSADTLQLVIRFTPDPKEKKRIVDAWALVDKRGGLPGIPPPALFPTDVEFNLLVSKLSIGMNKPDFDYAVNSIAPNKSWSGRLIKEDDATYNIYLGAESNLIVKWRIEGVNCSILSWELQKHAEDKNL